MLTNHLILQSKNSVSTSNCVKYAFSSMDDSGLLIKFQIRWLIRNMDCCTFVNAIESQTIGCNRLFTEETIKKEIMEKEL